MREDEESTSEVQLRTAERAAVLQRRSRLLETEILSLQRRIHALQDDYLVITERLTSARVSLREIHVQNAKVLDWIRRFAAAPVPELEHSNINQAADEPPWQILDEQLAAFGGD